MTQTASVDGANMQRQAVPLLNPAPFIGTGANHFYLRMTQVALLCKRDENNTSLMLKKYKDSRWLITTNHCSGSNAGIKAN